MLTAAKDSGKGPTFNVAGDRLVINTVRCKIFAASGEMVEEEPLGSLANPTCASTAAAEAALPSNRATYLHEPSLDQLNATLLAIAAHNPGPDIDPPNDRQNGPRPNVWFGDIENGAAKVIDQKIAVGPPL